VDEEGRPGLAIPHFEHAPLLFDDPTDYMDEITRLANSRTMERMLTLADILGALRAAGMRLDRLRELPRLAWQMFPHLIRDAEGMWTWPDRAWLPLAVSLRMTREPG
jgi:hypothetical protein